MKCSKIQKKLSDYLDNALPDNEKEVITDHLKTCQSCQEEFSTLKKLQSALCLLDDISVPDGFTSNLIGRIHEIERKTESTVPYAIFGRTVMAAACVAMVLLSIIFGNHIGKTLYKKTSGKRLPRDSRTIEVLKTQAGIELTVYLKNNSKYGFQVGGVQ